MAYSDWEFYRRYDTYNDVRSDPSGSAITNASLSNPLVSSGDYCRSFFASNGSPFDGRCEFRTFLPSYVNIPLNKAISIRAKVRVQETTTDPKQTISRPFNTFIGITAYSGYPTSNDQVSSVGYESPGYALTLQRYREAGENGLLKTRLVMISDDSSYTPGDFHTNPDSHIIATCSGSYSPDTWYDIRLDVIPNSLTSRTLNAYTSSNGGSSWDEVATYSLDNTSPLWRSTGKIGFINTFATDVAWNSDTFVNYIDDFKLNVVEIITI
jgi:hypothetical protein